MHNFTQKQKLWIAITLFMGLAPFIHAQNFRFRNDKKEYINEEQVEREVAEAMEHAMKKLEMAMQQMEWQKEFQERNWEAQLQRALAQAEAQVHPQEDAIRNQEDVLRKLERKFNSEEWSDKWREIAEHYRTIEESFDYNFDFDFDHDYNFDFNFDFDDNKYTDNAKYREEELARRKAYGFNDTFTDRIREFEDKIHKEEAEFRRFENEIKDQLLADGFIRYRDDKVELKLKDEVLTINGETLYGTEKRRYERILERHEFNMGRDTNLTIKF